MKITIQSPTAQSGNTPVLATVVLGDDTGKAATITGWLPRRSINTQIVAPLRATNKVLFDRKNASYQFSFVAFRSLESYAAALMFMRDHFRNMPNQGLVEIGQFDTTSVSLFFPDALLSDMEVIEHRGVAFSIRYTVQAGTMVPVNPNSTP